MIWLACTEISSSMSAIRALMVCSRFLETRTVPSSPPRSGWRSGASIARAIPRRGRREFRVSPARAGWPAAALPPLTPLAPLDQACSLASASPLGLAPFFSPSVAGAGLRLVGELSGPSRCCQLSPEFVGQTIVAVGFGKQAGQLSPHFHQLAQRLDLTRDLLRARSLGYS